MLNTDYIPCIAWGRNARYSEGLVIGDNVKIWGRIQSRQYQKKFDSGEVISKTAFEVSVSKMEIMGAEGKHSDKEVQNDENQKSISHDESV